MKTVIPCSVTHATEIEKECKIIITLSINPLIIKQGKAIYVI
jgi:hypothetical protein